MNTSAPRVVLGLLIGALLGLALGLAFGRAALAVALGAAAGAMLIGVFEVAKTHRAGDEAERGRRGTSVGVGIALAGAGTFSASSLGASSTCREAADTSARGR